MNMKDKKKTERGFLICKRAKRTRPFFCFNFFVLIIYFFFLIIIYFFCFFSVESFLFCFYDELFIIENKNNSAEFRIISYIFSSVKEKPLEL